MTIRPVNNFRSAVDGAGNIYKPRPTARFNGKFPDIFHNYESQHVPNIFFAGTTTHSLDFKKSAGGFIHGFRYTSMCLCHGVKTINLIG